MDRKPVLTPGVKRWLLIALVVALGVYAFLKAFPPVQRAAIDSTSIVSSQGYGYYAPIRLASVRPDSNEQPGASELVLHEDGRILGPAHTTHAEIFAVGAGRYSHWGDNVIFSASDNSDPRSNGRAYAASVTLALPGWLDWVAATLAVAALVVARADRWVIPATRRLRRVTARFDNPLWLFGLAVLLSVALGLGSAMRPTFAATISPDQIRASQGIGYAFTAPVSDQALYPVFADTNASPMRSNAVVTENGVELPSPHSAHASIFSEGAGRFSHWRNDIVFSTSDNTDPRTNGRTYRVEAKGELTAWIWAPALALIAALVLRALLLFRAGLAPESRLAHHLKSPADPVCLLLAIGAGLLALHDVAAASAFYPTFSNDSATYLAWPAQRGYVIKLLVDAGLALNLGPQWIVVFQFAAYMAAAFTLGWSVGRTCRSPALGWLLTAVLLVDTQILMMLWTLLSEPIFIPLLMLHLAFGLEALRTGKARNLAVCAGAAALAILVRPAGYGLFVGLTVLVLLIRPWQWRRTFIGAGAFAAVIIAGTLPNLINHRTFATHVVGGFALLGHVIQLADKDANYDDPEMAQALIDATAGISTASTAAYPDEYWKVTTNEYNTLLWATAIPAAKEILEERLQVELPRDDEEVNALIDPPFRSMSITIILDNPIAYARHVLAHVYGMWAVSFRPPGMLGADLATASQQSDLLVEKNPKLQEMVGGESYPSPDLEEKWNKSSRTQLTTDVIWGVVRPVLQVLVLPVAVLSFALVLAAAASVALRKEMPQRAAAAAFCSVQLWAYIGVVALSQVALARYAAVSTVMYLPIVAIVLSAAMDVLRKTGIPALQRWRPLFSLDKIKGRATS